MNKEIDNKKMSPKVFIVRWLASGASFATELTLTTNGNYVTDRPYLYSQVQMAAREGRYKIRSLSSERSPLARA